LARVSDSSSETAWIGAGSWIIAAAASALALGGAMLAIRGADRAGVETAVAWTGRLAFAFFWPSYVGGALATLFGSRFQPLKRRGRALGLGFAAVIAVHLSLVAWLSWVGEPPTVGTFIVFGMAAFWVFALAAASIKRVSIEIGPAGWWVLRNIGMNYIALAFALDFLRIQQAWTLPKLAEYVPFAVLSVLGPLLRLLAWMKKLLREGAAPPRWM
jgi:hypothetical protein